MRMCLNPKVLAGLAIAAAGILIVAPQAFVAALPVLLLLACPLSMLFMMRGMAGNQNAATCDADRASTDTAGDAELARLRAEVDQLQAELRGRRQKRPTPPAPPRQS